MSRGRTLMGLGFCLAAFTMIAGPSASADHSWGPYHWPTSSHPFNVALGDNVGQSETTDWDSLLSAVSQDWTASSVLNTSVVTGANVNNPKRCKAVSGRTEVCNARFGWNGWIGLAQIWVSGSHIGKAVAKVNDNYLDHPFYSPYTAAKRQVLCQEVGHTLGLDHQGANSCMNDENDLIGSAYPSPNRHDYDQLELIYSHLDAAGGGNKPGNGRGNGKGQVKRLDEDLYVKNLGGKRKLFTWVTWKDDAASRRAPSDRLPG